MKTIGRIIMVAVGIGMIALSIYFGYDAVKATIQFRWSDVQTFIDYLPTFIKAFQCLSYFIFGVAAIVSAIRGKAFFRYFIYSILILGFTIYNLYLVKSSGGEVTAKSIFDLVVEFVAPALYIIGSFCLLFN